MYLILISVAVALGLNNLLLLSNIAAYSPKYQEAVEILYQPSFELQILYTVVMAPVIEELLFRGLLFKVLRRWLPFWLTMSISALGFGLYHGNLVQFIYATLCGFLFAYFCEKFHSLMAAIFSHMIMNLVSITMTQFGFFQWIFSNPFTIIVSTVLCVILFGYGFWNIQKMDVT